MLNAPDLLDTALPTSLCPVRSQTLPLCVDLDGTLLSNDTLHDAALAVILAD